MRDPEEGEFHRKGASGELNSGTSMPPSALRKGKFDASVERVKALDLSIIGDIFGECTSLYDVLNIDPHAEAAEIRRAYLRQGRATLVNGGISCTVHNAPLNLDDVPEHARKKFQATSIAFEILSSPELRYEYDRYGVVHNPSVSPSKGRQTNKRQNSVRWKPYVQEKIIPDDQSLSYSYADEPSESTSCSTPKKEKQENGWIEHIWNIDKEAEKFLRGDGFENFIDDMFNVKASLGSLIGSMGRRDSTQFTDDSSSAVESREDSECSVDNNDKPAKHFLTTLRAQSGLFLSVSQSSDESYSREQQRN